MISGEPSFLWLWIQVWKLKGKNQVQLIRSRRVFQKLRNAKFTRFLRVFHVETVYCHKINLQALRNFWTTPEAYVFNWVSVLMLVENSSISSGSNTGMLKNYYFLNKLWPSKPNSFTLNLGIRNENWSSPFQTSVWFDHWWRLKYSEITIWRKNAILIITIWTGLSIDWTNQSKDKESHKKFHFYFLKKFRLYTHKITKEKLQLNLIKQSFTLLYGKVLDFWLFCVGNLIIFQSLISFVQSFSDEFFFSAGADIGFRFICLCNSYNLYDLEFKFWVRCKITLIVKLQPNTNIKVNPTANVH